MVHKAVPATEAPSPTTEATVAMPKAIYQSVPARCFTFTWEKNRPRPPTAPVAGMGEVETVNTAAAVAVLQTYAPTVKP